jgi:GNAT superfamily N-acetyltransferase
MRRGSGENAAMARSFTTFAVAGEDVAVVFPLVHAAVPEIDLGRWRHFARHLLEESAATLRGAIGLRNAAGYVCGLLTYRAERDLRHGLVLTVDLFTALDLVNGDQATRALLQAAEAKARELGCAATHIRLGIGQKSELERFAAAGHHAEATVCCRHLAPEPRPS